MRATVLLFFLLCASGPWAQEPDPQQNFQDAAQAQQRGDLVLAVSKYQEVIRLDPNVVAAHANLGVVLVSLGRFDEAITQYHIALAEAPGSPALQLDLGLAYYKRGDFAGAAAQFASLHKEDPSDLRAATLLGNCQVQLGLVGQAVALLEPLEKANPDNLDLGLTLFDQAKENAQAVIRLNPSAAKAYVVLGMIDDFAGNEKDAQDNYR